MSFVYALLDSHTAFSSLPRETDNYVFTVQSFKTRPGCSSPDGYIRVCFVLAPDGFLTGTARFIMATRAPVGYSGKPRCQPGPRIGT